MMNLIAISLIATSIVVSGLFSPNPQNNGGNADQVIVKGGHRAVVVEYGDGADDGNTKVFIKSPQHSNEPGPVDEKLSRAAASVAGVAQDVKGKAQDVVTGQDGPYGARPRELICDAFGKCKHKIAGVWGKTKEKVAEAEEAVEDVMDKAKDFASKAGHKAEETAEGVRDDVKQGARKTGEAAERVRDKTGEKIRETGENVREKAEKVKGKTGDMIEETGEKMRKTGENVREKTEKVKGKTEDMIEETGEMIKEKGKKGKEEFIEIAKRGRDVVFDVVRYINGVGYVIVKETMRTLLGLSELIGIASAYGIAIWVTFINSHVLAGILARQQFGMVQSKIYPVYFKAMVGSIGLGLLGHLLGHKGDMFKNKAHMLQAYNLMTSLLFVLGNLLFLEPRATKAMFDRMKLEKEEGRGRDRGVTRVIDAVVTDSAGATATTTATTTTAPTTTAPSKTTPVGRSEKEKEKDKAKSKLAKLDERLKKLNSLSSLLNIMTLMGLTWHLVYLSQRLRANTC